MRFAWPVFTVVAALALLVLPWTNQRIEDLKYQYEKRSDLERIEPGQFQESGNGTRVFFVEKNTTGQQSGSNVFIATTERGKETITSARSGRIDTLPQGQFLMLSNGQRLESVIGTTDLKVSEFEVYGAQVSTDALSVTSYTPVNTLTTRALFANLTPASLGELSWRLGLVLAAINFVIIGVAVSNVNPRVNKSVNLVFSLFTFVFYYNLLNLGQSWIASGKYSMTAHMFTLHGGIFVLATLWLAKGHNNWHWHNLTGRKTRPQNIKATAS
jgi:lipopolysaccharide export system permease protein